MKSVFDPATTRELIARVTKVQETSAPQWGTMNAAQMLAHCNVTYEMAYEDRHPKPNVLMRFILKTLVKPKVVSEEPYARNSRTGPQFLVDADQDFNLEKNRLIDYLNQTTALGVAYFEGKDSNSFGPLTANEWNHMFYKHLDHHLRQFGC